MFTLLLIVTGLTSNASAEVFLGEYCWRILAEGEPIEDGSIYKMGVYRKKGKHFELYGVYDGDQAVHGHIEPVGSDAYAVTLVESADYGDEVVSATTLATLNVTTLSGPSHTIGLTADPNTGAVEPFYVPHTMTLITCPDIEGRYSNPKEF